MKLFKTLLMGFLCVCILTGTAWAGEKQTGEKATPVKKASMKDVEAATANQKAVTIVSGQTSAANHTQNVPEKKIKAENMPSKKNAPGEDKNLQTETLPEKETAGSMKALPETASPEPQMTSAPETADEDFAEPAPQNKTQTGSLTFNFDNADLAEVIRTMADLLKINYIIDPKISGKVTIHTAGKLDRKDILPIFYQILEINGLTALKQGDLFKIVPAKDASRLPITSRTGRESKNITPGEEMVIQIIRLNSISADEMSKILTPFVSSEGVIITHAGTNTLMVVDRAYNIEKVLRLVNVFDADVFQRVCYRFYPLKYGDVDSLVDTMNKMIAAYGSEIKASTVFIPIDRLNTLLVVGANPKVLDEISEFIKNYDVPSESTEPAIFVYPVKNGQAKDIADLLNDVFKGMTEKENGKKSSSGVTYQNPLSEGAVAERKAQEKAASQVQQPAASQTGGNEATVSTKSLKGQVYITADETRNSLIIQASPQDYQIIKNLLAQVDIMPRQVLIEVTIAEITLDNKTAMGVEWSYNKGPQSLGTSMLNATLGNSGLNFTLGNADRWNATMSALASKNKVNILSSPTILASNSLPATIDISTEIPLATSQYQYTTVANPVLSTDIEYRDTGVLLTVTPHINELGLVTMDINQEVSEEAGNVSVGGKDYPSFFKRSAKTTLTVQSGQTIVIGGLIKETKSNGTTGTPWFDSVPILSFLFGKASNETQKTELILMISPYVIKQMDDVEAVSNEFRSKLTTLFPDIRTTPAGILEKYKK